MDIPVALLLFGISIALWRSGMKLPGAILALVVAGTLGGDRTPEVMTAINHSLAGGIGGDLLLLAIVAVGFALACGWRPRGSSRRHPG